MLFLKKFSVYFSSLVVLILFYFILQYPEKILYLIALTIFILYILFKFLVAKKISLKETIIFFSIIFFLIISCALFLLIIENLYLKYFVLILVALLVGAFFELVFVFLHRSHKYQPFSLNRYCEYISVLNFFFISSGLFALHIFLNLSFWFPVLILTILANILFCLNLWLNKIDIKKHLYYIYIFALLIFELTLGLAWLSISFYLKGFLLTVFYFLFVKFSNYKLKESWDKKKVLFYIFGSLIICLVALSTARWL